MKEFKKLNVDSLDLNRVQDNVEAVFLSLRSPLNNCLLLTDLSLSAGDNTISHKLNNVLQGYILVRSSASVTLYDKQKTNPIPNKTLVLNASGAAVVSLLVF